MLTKQNSLITFQKLSSRDFWRIANSVHNKVKSAIPPLFNRLQLLFSASDKAKLFAKNITKKSHLDDLGISLSVFSFGTNLKLRNIHVTSKLVKVINNVWRLLLFVFQ